MKKNVWLLGMAVAALTSCTQSEVVDIPESRVIDFETFVDKPTRASDDVIDAESAKFKEFYVYAAKGTKTAPEAAISFDSDLVLDQQQVKGGRGSWSYEPHATWVSENYYRFAAYANGNADGNATQAKLEDKVTFKKGTTLAAKDWGLTFNDYQVAEGKDLVVAIADEKYTGTLASEPGSVALNFKHILSKVEFRFYYTPTVTGQYLEIESFGFDAATMGDCETNYTGSENLIGATWTPASFTRNDEDGFDYSYFDGTEATDGKLSSGNIHEAHYVIPQPTTSLVVPKITIKTMNAEGEVQSEQSFTNVSLATATTTGHDSWLPGYVYRYEATLSGKLHEIHFTTSVKNWDSTLPVLPVQ